MRAVFPFPYVATNAQVRVFLLQEFAGAVSDASAFRTLSSRGVFSEASADSALFRLETLDVAKGSAPEGSYVYPDDNVRLKVIADDRDMTIGGATVFTVVDASLEVFPFLAGWHPLALTALKAAGDPSRVRDRSPCWYGRPLLLSSETDRGRSIDWASAAPGFRANNDRSRPAGTFVVCFAPSDETVASMAKTRGMLDAVGKRGGVAFECSKEGVAEAREILKPDAGPDGAGLNWGVHQDAFLQWKYEAVFGQIRAFERLQVTDPYHADSCPLQIKAEDQLSFFHDDEMQFKCSLNPLLEPTWTGGSPANADLTGDLVRDAVTVADLPPRPEPAFAGAVRGFLRFAKTLVDGKKTA